MTRRWGTHLFGQSHSGLEAEGTRFSILGGLGRLRSGGEKLGPLLSDPCSVCGRRLRSVLVPRFLSPAASWTPIAGPLAAHCFPALPASALRKAPFLPTESSASAYGKLRLCPTESSVSAYRKLRLCLRRAPL